jgi:outer membrane protein assembly factor BamB
MNRKSITLALGGVLLCTTIVISPLFLTSPHTSRAASRLATASNLQSSSSSSTDGILTGSVFYGTTGSSVYALNATTGALIWTYHLKGFASALLLGLHQGTVFIGLYNGPQDYFLAALQATNGSLVWLSAQQWIYPPLISSFQVVNGHIYFLYNAGESSILYAFNANNGSYLWSSEAFGMVIRQGSIYTYDYATMGGPPEPKICALNANDGSVRWCYHDASMVVYNYPMLLYVNGIVYANFRTESGDYGAVALNANDGSLLWIVAGMGVASVVQNIAFATNQNDAEALDASNGWLLVQYQHARYLFSHNGIVYASDSNNDLVAFRQSDGTILWSYTFLGVGLNTCLPPMNGVLYCLGNDDKTEFALNATYGTFLWKYSLGSVNSSSPCPYAFNNVLYCIGNGYQTLFALNTTSGTLLWKHGLLSSPGLLTSLNGITYVLTCTGTNDICVVHAYNAMTGTLLWKY